MALGQKPRCDGWRNGRPSRPTGQPYTRIVSDERARGLSLPDFVPCPSPRVTCSHAAATGPSIIPFEGDGRRVLHVAYAAAQPGDGLRWR